MSHCIRAAGWLCTCLSSGSHHEEPRTGWLKKTELYFLAVLEAENLGASLVDSGPNRLPGSQTAPVFLCSHMAKWQETCSVECLLRALIPSWGLLLMAPSDPDHLISKWPSLWVGVRAPTWGALGAQRHSVHNTPSLTPAVNKIPRKCI